jgi:hypothetical protein
MDKKRLEECEKSNGNGERGKSESKKVNERKESGGEWECC